MAPAATEEITEAATATTDSSAASPLAAAATRDQAIAKLIDNLQPGEMLFNAPSEMQVAQPEVIVVRLTRSPGDNELTLDVPGNGAAVVESVPYVGMYMKVRLGGDAFDIHALSEEEQIVPETGYTQWSWQVTPTRSGTQQLFLTASVSVELAKDDVKRRDLPIIQKDVHVQVNPIDAITGFVQTNWQLLISLPVVTTGASFIVQRVRSRAKAKKETDTH